MNNITEDNAYEKIGVDGNEAEALTDSYYDLYELLGTEAMLKLYKQYHGDKIDCPMKLYRAEYIADLVSQTSDRKKRAEIARAGGYALKFIEGIIQRRKKRAASDLQNA